MKFLSVQTLHTENVELPFHAVVVGRTPAYIWNILTPYLCGSLRAAGPGPQPVLCLPPQDRLGGLTSWREPRGSGLTCRPSTRSLRGPACGRHLWSQLWEEGHQGCSLRKHFLGCVSSSPHQSRESIWCTEQGRNEWSGRGLCSDGLCAAPHAGRTFAG